MKVEYHFAVPSLIYLGGDELPSLEFKRAAIDVTVQKPSDVVRADGFILNQPVDPDSLLCASVTDFFLTKVIVSLESKEDIPRQSFSEVLYPIAYGAVNSLTVWIRVLTHQYWIGHKYGPFNQQVHLVFVTDGEGRKLVNPPQSTTGFDWWKPVTRDIWDRAGMKLRDGLSPRLGQLFFCDALLYLLEFNLDAGAALLGIACDLEVSNLLKERRRARNGENASASSSRKELPKGDNCYRTRGSQRLRKNIEKIGQLYQVSSPLDTETLKSLDELMARRGQAVHAASTPPLHGAPIPAGAGQMGRLAIAAQPVVSCVKAAGQLFSWLDALRP